MTARLVAAVLVAACAGGGEPRSETPPRVAFDAAVPGTDGALPEASVAPGGAAMRAVALVTDPVVLDALARPSRITVRYDALLDEAARGLIERTIAADVAAAGKGDPDAGVGIAGNTHRLFDVGWLTRGRMELIGLAYRIDRIPVTARTCGDLRLIYRLAYRAKTAGVEVGSRLPLTVTLVFDGPRRNPSTPTDPLGCRDAANAWRVAANLDDEDLADHLRAHLRELHPGGVRQVLTNTQVVRWPSAVRPDLAGHAEYALRAFRPDGQGRLALAPADHTPDVSRRRELLAWLQQPATLDALELGWAQLPPALTAQKALSVSPRNFARRANRPWRQLFAPEDLAALPLAGRAQIGSPAALLRRLDEHTCNGCHQAQSIAGFHMLGEDGKDVAPGNAMAVAISAPVTAEARRREALIDAIARGERPDLTRPAFERTGNQGGRGARCGLGDAGFAAWTCSAGLTCQATDAPRDDAEVGECLPPPDRREVGDPCELGPLVAHANPRRDRGPKVNPTACVDAACNTNRVGFPGGMCSAGCDDLPAGATCGVIAVLTPFNNCLARGRPFPACIGEHVRPAALRGCDATHPCRDDYVCARTPAGTGGCMPPYFLFQLRVDGHPPSKSAI